MSALSPQAFGVSIPSMSNITTALSVISAVLVIIVLIAFTAHSVSFPRVFKNVHRNAYASVSVDASGNITLDSVYDPYKILTGSTFGGASANVSDANGVITVTVGNRHYDFTKSTVTASITSSTHPGIISVAKTQYGLILTPLHINDATFSSFSGVDPYTFDLKVEAQQPATI